MKDQVTASLTGSGWLEEAGREAPPDQQTDQTVRGKGMSKNQRNTFHKFREIYVTESVKYMSKNERNTQECVNGWLKVSEKRPSRTSSRPTKQSGGKAESLKWNSLECGWYVWHF